MPSKIKVSYAWVQPCCPRCWKGLVLKTGMKVIPAGIHDPFSFPALCCYCRAEMYREDAYSIRVNPGAVPYPTLKKDKE